MSKTVQWKRGNTSVNSTYTGAAGEITVDTDLWAMRVHDGTTVGGHPVSASGAGNLLIIDQTISGTRANGNITLTPLGAAGFLVAETPLYYQTSTAGNLSMYIHNAAGRNLATISTVDIFRNNATTGNTSLRLTANTNSIGLTLSNIGTMAFNTYAGQGYTFNLNGSMYASEYVAPGNTTVGYSFNTVGGFTGLNHYYQVDVHGNVSVMTLTHSGEAVAEFYDNLTTELSGNLVVSASDAFNTFPNAFISVYSNVNSYSQLINQNVNNGTQASTDFVATADNGTDSAYYIDMGITGSNACVSSFFGDTTAKNDGYLYVVGYNAVGPSTGNIGNLILGSTNGVVKTFIGNTAQANVVTLVNSAGFMPGANVTYSLGSSSRQWKDLWVSNSTIYIGGSPLTVTANGVLTVNGNPVLTSNTNSTVSTTGNITGNYFFGNGSQLTGLAATYSNSNVASYLPTYSGDIAANIVKNGNTWTFGNDGNLSVPGSINFTSSPAGVISGVSSISTGTLTASGNVTILGNLTVNGNATTIFTNNLIVNDNIIYLANANPANSLDIGFAGHFTSNIYQHTGLVRQASSNSWKLFSNVIAEPGNTIDFTNAVYDPIQTGNITAPYFIGNGSQLTGLAATYGNSNVASYITTYGGPINANVITGTANATVNGLTVNTSGVFTTTVQAAGGLQNTPIGNVAGQASTGSFTTITANGNLTVAAITSNGTITATTIGAATIGNASAIHTGASYYASGNYYGVLGAASFANAATVTTLSANGNITASAITVNNSVTVGTTLGVTGNATVGNLSTVGVIVGNASPGAAGTISNAVGYLGIPQNSQSTGYTLALIDQGKHVYVTANSNVTIPANSSVSFPIGSTISVINAANIQCNILITTDTLYLAANGATGTRNLSSYGMATLVKVANTVWYINGSGIT